IGGGPHVSTSNPILRPGAPPAPHLEKIERGLYVPDPMGFGVNGGTRDYSPGAGGFWVERRGRAVPGGAGTIAAQLDDLWKRVDGMGDDLDTRSSTQCPTFRVSHMTVSGT